VLGDGHQSLLAGVVEDVLRRAGAVVHEAARDPGGDDGMPLAVHGAASASCWSVQSLSGPEGGSEVRVTACGPLREFDDTRAAATAVLCGRPIPRADAREDALREIGRTLQLPLADLASAADPGALFAAARAALAPLLRENGRLSARDRMTKCEQVAALLSAVAVDRLHWELLAQCVEHGASRRIDRETLLQCLVSDPEWAPHPDVCAGGDWYLGLERLRSVAAAARAEGTAAQRGTARCAWRALTTLLVLLAWWNHRFATAGDRKSTRPNSSHVPSSYAATSSRSSSSTVRPSLHDALPICSASGCLRRWGLVSGVGAVALGRGGGESGGNGGAARHRSLRMAGADDPAGASGVVEPPIRHRRWSRRRAAGGGTGVDSGTLAVTDDRYPDLPRLVAEPLTRGHVPRGRGPEGAAPMTILGEHREMRAAASAIDGAAGRVADPSPDAAAGGAWHPRNGAGERRFAGIGALELES